MKSFDKWIARGKAIAEVTMTTERIIMRLERVMLSRRERSAAAEPVRVLLIAYAVTNERDMTATFTAPTMKRNVLSVCLKN